MTQTATPSEPNLPLTSSRIKLLLTALIDHIDIVMSLEQLSVKERMETCTAAWRIVQTLLLIQKRTNAAKPGRKNGGTMSHNTHCET